jgi:hypothetical protein
MESKWEPPRGEGYHIDVPNGPVLSKEVKQLLWSDVVAGGKVRTRCLQYTGSAAAATTYLRFFTNKALSMAHRLAKMLRCNDGGRGWRRPEQPRGQQVATRCGEGREAAAIKAKGERDSPIYLRAKFVGSTHISMSI